MMSWANFQYKGYHCCQGDYHYKSSFVINSLAIGYGTNFQNIIFQLIMQSSSLGTCCEIAHRGIPQNLFYGKWTLVQVMTWCHYGIRQQAISWANVDSNLCHYMASLGHNELIGYNVRCKTNWPSWCLRCSTPRIWVNTMAAVALAPRIVRPSAASILIM